MGANTKIEWCDHSWNPWRGCTKISEGCKHCYAETMSARNPAVLGEWGPAGRRVIAAETYWQHPHRWNREAKQFGIRRRVFCASLADVFEGPETMPEKSRKPVEEARVRLLETIDNTQWLDWLLLTKRPENIMEMVPPHWKDKFPDNVWVGTTIENQETEKRIGELIRVPARVRFLSCEPLLGSLDLQRWLWSKGGTLPPDHTIHVRSSLNMIHWIIAGGESGPNARPMHPDWARSLRDQCDAAGVPFFFKQWGASVMTSQMPFDTLHALQEKFGEGVGLPDTWYNVGQKRAGRLLDGREWNEVPS